MFRSRVAGMLVVAAALLATACGEVIVGDPPAEVEAPTTTTTIQPGPERSEAENGPAEADIAESSDRDDATGAGSDVVDDAVSTGDSTGAAPVDAEALLASAATQLGDRSARGEATIEFAPGFELSTSFESDADGDLVVTTEIPPGLDLEFAGPADAEVRYVGGVAYVRPEEPVGTLDEPGLDEAWFVAESAADSDPISSAGGVTCVFPQALYLPFGDCDLMGKTGAFLEAARGAEIVGREDVRGVEATRVRFVVSLLDAAGGASGTEPDEDDGETPEGGAFDDIASDPFAEGLDQFFGFFDPDLEVDVWIDDKNLIRRLAFDLASLFAGLAGADAEVPSILITLEFYDFDADISVEAPPPELIVDDPDLLIGGDDYATSEEYEPGP